MISLKEEFDRIIFKKRPISILSTDGFGSVSSLLRFDFGSAAILPLGYRRLYERKKSFLQEKNSFFYCLLE